MAASGGLRMTEDLLKAKSGQFDLESIQWLDLTGCGIARMENLAQLTSLQELRLGRNNVRLRCRVGCAACRCPGESALTRWSVQLKEISDLGEKPRLSYLDLSDNKLSGLSESHCSAAPPPLRLTVLCVLRWAFWLDIVNVAAARRQQDLRCEGDQQAAAADVAEALVAVDAGGQHKSKPCKLRSAACCVCLC